MRAFHPSSKNKAPTPAGAFSLADRNRGLPHGEVHFVEIDVVVSHLAVPVLLIVDGDSVPACLAGIFVFVDGMGDTVQGDGFEEQTIVGCPLYLDDEVIPSVVFGIARNTSGDPFLVYVVVDVPFVATRDAAFVAPNEAFAELAPHELVDIEFQCLRGRQLRSVEIRFIDEIVGVVRERVVRVGKLLTGE